MNETSTSVSILFGDSVGVNYNEDRGIILFSFREGGHDYSIEMPEKHIEHAYQWINDD